MGNGPLSPTPSSPIRVGLKPKGTSLVQAPGPPTEHSHSHVCSAATWDVCVIPPGSQVFHAPRRNPTHLAVLDEANKMLKAIVAKEGGLQHWPVLTCQHHGDGICAGVEVTLPSRHSPAAHPPFPPSYRHSPPQGLGSPYLPSMLTRKVTRASSGPEVGQTGQSALRIRK